MERCNKAGEGFECVRLLGHAGECECVSAGMFNTLMEDAENAFLYGNKAKCTCGRRTPFPHCHASDCPFYSPESKGVCGEKAEALILDYIGNRPNEPERVWDAPVVSQVFHNDGVTITSEPPVFADELGKVWDVLHANGINGAGVLSASEGVQQLVDTFDHPRDCMCPECSL